MPEFETETQAAEALYTAVLEDGNGRSDQQALSDRVAEIKAGESKPDVAAEGSTEGATEQDSFSNIDPNSLPPELQAQYRSMQADYTRKTQSVAERSKQFDALEEFGGAEAALEAVKFTQALATDPEYAVKVHEQLTQALTEAGLTPAQAVQEAARQIDEAAGVSDDFVFEDDSAVAKRLAALEAQLKEQTDWRTGQEKAQFELKLANEMQRQENDILQQHPEYTEQDMDDIYNLSYSVGGNLAQAATLFSGLKDRVLNDYLAKKSSVTAGASGVSSSVQSAEVPTKFTNLFDPDLEKLVNERLAQEVAAGNNI